MPAKDARTARHEVSGNPHDPQGMHAAATHYFASLTRQNYAAATIAKKRDHLNHLIGWGSDRELVQPQQLTLPLLETYLRQLRGERNGRGQPRSYADQYARLVTLRAWMTWLVKHQWLPFSPAAQLAAPKLPRKLPRHLLTAAEAEAVLQQPDVTTPLGLRDRALLEVLYSTALRRMELGRLRTCDVDFDRAVVTVLEGKGRRDRVVPIGRRAMAWATAYLTDVRPQLDQGCGRLELFLTCGGREFSGAGLSQLVRQHLVASGVAKPGGCHLFRHATATLMLEGGADVRYVQQMLGHKNLATTQIYTHVSIRKLQEVHERTHPARWDRPDQRPPELDADAPAADAPDAWAADPRRVQ